MRYRKFIRLCRAGRLGDAEIAMARGVYCGPWILKWWYDRKHSRKP